MDKWAGFAINTTVVPLTTSQNVQILPANPSRQFFVAAVRPPDSGSFWLQKVDISSTPPNKKREISWFQLPAAAFSNGAKADFPHFGTCMQGAVWCAGGNVGSVVVSEITLTCPFMYTMPGRFRGRNTSWKSWTVFYDNTAGPIEILAANPNRFAIALTSSTNAGLPLWSFGKPNSTGGTFASFGFADGTIGYDNIGDLICEPMYVAGPSLYAFRILEVYVI